MTRETNWMYYNWSEITTLAMFTDFNSSLLCYAHSKGVRVVPYGSYPVSELIDIEKRRAWTQNQLKLVQELHADGLNIDIEDPTRNNTNDTYLLTVFVEEIYTAFKNANENYQVTFDLAWSPDCIDGRCYQAKEIADITDFVVIMAYSERSQIFGPCIASANSGFPTTAKGVQEYLDLGIPANKLVLGLPWEGCDYPCLSLMKDNVCTIPRVPFRGANCSDAVAGVRSYGNIRELILNSTVTVYWNETLQSPYLDYKDPETSQEHQVWYDNVESLTIKYNYARQQQLRGLAFWSVDRLDYSDTPRAKKETAEMWKAISVFLHD